MDVILNICQESQLTNLSINICHIMQKWNQTLGLNRTHYHRAIVYQVQS